MPLPRSQNINAPGQLMHWLRTDPRMSKVYRAIRDKAPHLLTQAAMGALGQDDITSTFVAPTFDASVPSADIVSPDVTSTFMAPSIEPVAPTIDVGSSTTPIADPGLPGGSSGGWADTVAKLATPAITAFEQVKLFNTQLSLAQQGKPLLRPDQIRLPAVPLRVSVPQLTGTGSLLIAGVGILAVLFLLGGRRRP